jgi:hypothetical protein
VADEYCDSVERVRQHVRKRLVELTAQQRERRIRDKPPSPLASRVVAVEVEREKDRSARICYG